MYFNDIFAICPYLILPVIGEPVFGGSIVIKNGKIEHILDNQTSLKILPNLVPQANIYDKPDAILMPGLINLHTHLDYSLINLPTSPLFNWIPSLMKLSRGLTPADFVQANNYGVEQALLSGTTTLVDCSYTGLSIKPLNDYGLKALVGLELFGISAADTCVVFEKFLTKMESLARQVQELHPTNSAITLTISPHSLYTVGVKLFDLAYQWCLANNTILLSHISESVWEKEWTQNGNDVIDNFLIQAFNLTQSELVNNENLARNCGLSSCEFLASHNLLNSNMLFAHGVHLQENDRALLGKHNLKLAICPRSNQYLQVGKLALSELNGLNVGFGTDSLASNCDLNLLTEANFAYNSLGLFNKVKPSQIVKMLTIEAARMLNFAHDIGSIEIGKRADVILLRPISKPLAANILVEEIYEQILALKFCVSEVYVAGRQVVNDGKIEKNFNQG